MRLYLLVYILHLNDQFVAVKANKYINEISEIEDSLTCIYPSLFHLLFPNFSALIPIYNIEYNLYLSKLYIIDKIQ